MRKQFADKSLRPARRWLLGLSSLVISCALLAQEPGADAVKTPRPATFGVLHNAEGVAETFAFCTPCHSEHIVAQQGLERDDWDEIFDYMEDEHGMAPLPEPIRSRILDYLADHYGTDRPHFPK